MKRVEQLIGQMDQEGAAAHEVHVLNLKNAEADSVSKTLNEIFVKSGARQQGNQPPPISISALPSSKAVLVKCRPDDFERINAVVNELDRDEFAIGEKVTLVTLLYADAVEVQEAMKQYLAKPGANGAGRGRGSELVGDTRIAVLAQNNSLVVSGESEKVDHVATLVRQMDEASEKGSVPQIIPMKFANVNQILPSLQETFGEKAGPSRKGEKPPVIVANEALNALVVRAGTTDMIAIEAIVAKLDTKEAGEKKPFKLVQVAPGINIVDLADRLERSVNESIRDASSRSGKSQKASMISIEPDKRTSTLLVAGNPAYFDDVEDMARAYQKLGPATGETIKIIQLSKTPSAEIIALIEQLKGDQAGSRSGRGARGGRSGRSGRSTGGRSSRPQSRPQTRPRPRR